MTEPNDAKRIWVGFKCSPEEKRIARYLGNGNVSHGIRNALRFAYSRKATPVPLSIMLRAAAEMARDLEGSR